MKSSGAVPDGVHPDPYLTFKKKLNPDPAVKKKTGSDSGLKKADMDQT